MRYFAWLCLFGVLFFGPSPRIHAQLMSGMKLHDYCHFASQDMTKLSNSEAVQMYECLYFIEGVLHGYAIADGQPAICIPDNGKVTLGELAMVVYKYSDQHPERLHIDASALVLESMFNGFACKANPPTH